jgi:hypothetical protein
VISIISTFSMLGSFFILFTVVFFGLHKSLSHRLIAYLSFSGKQHFSGYLLTELDILQSIAIQISYNWIHTGGPERGHLCLYNFFPLFF